MKREYKYNYQKQQIYKPSINYSIYLLKRHDSASKLIAKYNNSTQIKVFTTITKEDSDKGIVKSTPAEISERKEEYTLNAEEENTFGLIKFQATTSFAVLQYLKD